MLEGDDTLSQGLGILLKSKPLLGCSRAILIECIEGLLAGEVKNILAYLKNLESRNLPVILTCDDYFHSSAKELKKVCQVLTLKSMPKSLALKYLCSASSTLKNSMSMDSADILYENSHGNLRYALNEFEFMRKTLHRKKSEGSTSSLAECDLTWNLFKEVGKICMGIIDTSTEEIASSDTEIALMMLQHNLPSCATSIEKLAHALNFQSVSEIVIGYYEIPLAVSLATRSGAMACKGGKSMPKMMFPSILSHTSQKKSKALLCKSAALLHGQSCSPFEAMERLHTLQAKVKKIDTGGVSGCKELRYNFLWHEKKEVNEILRKGLWTK
jgi:hypothetical protein